MDLSAQLTLLFLCGYFEYGMQRFKIRGLQGMFQNCFKECSPTSLGALIRRLSMVFAPCGAKECQLSVSSQLPF